MLKVKLKKVTGTYKCLQLGTFVSQCQNTGTFAKVPLQKYRGKEPDYCPLSFYILLKYQYIRHAMLIKVKQPQNSKNKTLPRNQTSAFWLRYFESTEYRQKIPSQHLCKSYGVFIYLISISSAMTQQNLNRGMVGCRREMARIGL